MQPPQQVTSNNMFGDAKSLTQKSSSSFLLPPLPKQRICKSYKTIDVHDSDDDEDKRKDKNSFKKTKK